MNKKQWHDGCQCRRIGEPWSSEPGYRQSQLQTTGGDLTCCFSALF